MTRRRAGSARRAVASAAAVLGLVVVTSGCVADPPPPTVVGEERTPGEDPGSPSSGVLIALDSVEEGFNPHLIADQGIDTDLVSSLILPSAFEPGPDGTPRINHDLLVSAAPLPDAPDTIRYTIQPGAQWSDGVPVAAEDFEYLWRQMTTQPGVVDPAGYEQIEAVRSGAGGKVVDVEFEAPPQRWRTLFSDLLPGHILKDAPNGFQGAMARLPVMSAGPFMVRSADIGVGEIEFVRNDRYWATSPQLDQIVARRATGAGQLGAVLRGGVGAVAVVGATPVASDVAGIIQGVRTEEVDSALQLELGLNTVADAASSPAVRRAVAAAIDPEVVGRIVTDGAGSSLTSFPFPPGSAAPATARPETVRAELTAAGYSWNGTRWERDGRPLSLTLGVEEEDETMATAAHAVADQLRSAGIGARVWELDATALYADALPHGLVDGVVGWQRVDGDPVVAATSRFACAPEDVDADADGEADATDDSGSDGGETTDPDTPRLRPRTTVPGLRPPEPDTGLSTTPTTPHTSAAPTTGSERERTTGTDAPARTSGVYGVCDPELDRLLDDVRAGGSDPDAALAEAAERAADLALRVPLTRPDHLVADDSVDTGGDGPGGDRRSVTDVFDAAPTWRRTG